MRNLPDDAVPPNPARIGDNYFGVGELREELRSACVRIHNYTRLPETEHCRRLGQGESTIYQTGWLEYRIPNVPDCRRNEIIIGTATYEDGYWSDYECSLAG